MHPLKGVAPVEKPMGYYTVMNENSCGKDTMTGHWELMGIKTVKPFVTFTETGFPKELIEELEKRTGHKVIGNKSSSGTTILDELAEEEIATGHMIVYTSADSVLQICGNEETFGLDELYRCCEIARELTMRTNGVWDASLQDLMWERKKVNSSVPATATIMPLSPRARRLLTR